MCNLKSPHTHSVRKHNLKTTKVGDDIHLSISFRPLFICPLTDREISCVALLDRVLSCGPWQRSDTVFLSIVFDFPVDQASTVGGCIEDVALVVVARMATVVVRMMRVERPTDLFSILCLVLQKA